MHGEVSMVELQDRDIEQVLEDFETRKMILGVQKRQIRRVVWKAKYLSTVAAKKDVSTQGKRRFPSIDKKAINTDSTKHTSRQTDASMMNSI